MSEPIRVVYDCMILLQAAAKSSRVHSTMRLVEEQRLRLCMSAATIAQARDVLTRPEVCDKFPVLSAEPVDTFLNGLIARAMIWNVVP